MKNHILLVAAAPTFSISAFSKGSGHSHAPSPITGAKTEHSQVSRHKKKDGAYAAPRNRSTAKYVKNNSWATKGNVNPEACKAGTKNSDQE